MTKKYIVVSRHGKVVKSYDDKAKATKHAKKIVGEVAKVIIE